MGVKSFKDQFISWVADIRVYVGGLVLFGNSHYQIKGHHMRTILGILKPGDVLLRRYSHYLGGFFIPGYWSHAAFYEGNNQVIHMLGDGITREDILTFMRTDDIGILRCDKKDLVSAAVQKAQVLYEQQVGYDYDFKCDNKNLYCSELIYNIFGEPEDIKFKKFVLPDDLVCDLFTLLWKRGTMTKAKAKVKEEETDNEPRMKLVQKVKKDDEVLELKDEVLDLNEEDTSESKKQEK